MQDSRFVTQTKLTVPSTANLTNNGTLTVEGQLESLSVLTNNGTLNVATTGFVDAVGNLVNTKNVTVNGTLVCSKITNSSYVKVNEGGTLKCSGGTNTNLIYNEGTMDNSALILGTGGVIISTSNVENAEGQLVTGFQYLNEEGEVSTIPSECKVVPLAATDTTWAKQDGTITWYVAINDVTIEDGVKLNDDINLLLMDGVTVTIHGRNDNGGINATGHTLNIYSQSIGSQMGQLDVTAGHENWMAIGGTNSSTNVNIYGGAIDTTGDTGYSGLGAPIYSTMGSINVVNGILRTNILGHGYTVGSDTQGLYAPEGSNAVIYTEQEVLASNVANTYHGILFLQNNGTVYGGQELSMDLTVQENETLTIPEETVLTIPAGTTLTVAGTLDVQGILLTKGTIDNQGTISGDGEVRINLNSVYTGTEPTLESVTFQTCWDIDGDGVVDDTTYVQEGTMPTHADGEKEGTESLVYRFQAWDPELANATAPVVYTAQFIGVNQYTISYNATEGTGSMLSEIAIGGEDFTIPSCSFTAPEGKEFVIWAIGSEDSTNTIIPGATHTFTESTTLYAVWEDIYYDILTDALENGSISVDKSTAIQGDTVTFSVNVEQGYLLSSVSVTEDAAQTEILVQETEDGYSFDMPAGAVTISATIQADETAPTGTINVGEDSFSSFIEEISFEKSSEEKYEVTITAEDLETGIASIEYLLSNTAISREDIEQQTGWKTYEAFSIEEEGNYVVYAKITDLKGNVTYLSTDGFVFEKNEENPVQPQTGDNNALGIWGATMTISVIGTGTLVFFSRKKKRV